MNRRQKRTLEQIYTNPVLRNIEWRRIESLLVALNCELIEGSGSRVKIGDLRADFHRPHPGKEAKPYQVRAVREFLHKLEVEP